MGKLKKKKNTKNVQSALIRISRAFACSTDSVCKPIVCARNENGARLRFLMNISPRARTTRDNKCSIPLPTEAH